MSKMKGCSWSDCFGIRAAQAAVAYLLLYNLNLGLFFSAVIWPSMFYLLSMCLANEFNCSRGKSDSQSAPGFNLIPTHANFGYLCDSCFLFPHKGSPTPNIDRGMSQAAQPEPTSWQILPIKLVAQFIWTKNVSLASNTCQVCKPA